MFVIKNTVWTLRSHWSIMYLAINRTQNIFFKAIALKRYFKAITRDFKKEIDNSTIYLQFHKPRVKSTNLSKYLDFVPVVILEFAI